MDVRRVIEFIGRLEKELVLYNLEESDPLADRLEEHLDSQNVRIRTERTSSDAPRVAVLSDRDGVSAMIEIRLLRRFTSERSTRPETLGVADAEYAELLQHLKETTFTSYDRSEMLYASREVEDRARRVGTGTIHAGFQRLGVLRNEWSIYADLARRGVEVHAYGIPDVRPPDIGGGQVHAVETDEIASTWFVVFDGGGVDAQKSALIAEERDENGFYGAWTYDPYFVDVLQDHLEETYLSEPATGGNTSMDGTRN